jgi:inner membrane protein
VDVFTHALFGAKAAYAAAPGTDPLGTRDRILLGASAAAFPDVDFAAFLVDPLRFLADWHQAPTHSVVLLPVWAAAIGGLYVTVTGRRTLLGAAVLVSAIALASHIVSDLITVYGTAVFYPLSDVRVSLGTTFVIDPLFTALVLAGLASALAMRRPAVARIGLIALALYVGGQAYLQQRAIGVASVAAARQGFAVDSLAALPQPFSPFNWKLIAIDGDRYHESHVNLLGHRPLVPAALPFADVARAYRPPDQLKWRSRHRFGDAPERRGLVEDRWNDARFAPFRHFAVYPALSRLDRADDATCVWFTDLRYDLPALPDTFRYGFCRDAAGEPWELYRLRYFSDRARQRVGASD